MTARPRAPVPPVTTTWLPAKSTMTKPPKTSPGRDTRAITDLTPGFGIVARLRIWPIGRTGGRAGRGANLTSAQRMRPHAPLRRRGGDAGAAYASNEAMQLARSWGKVIGPHSIASRFLRKAGLLRNSAVYCSLSRMFAAAPGSFAVDWANAIPPDSSNTATAIIDKNLGIIPVLLLGSVGHCQPAADAQHLAGNVIRSSAQEKQYRLGDLDRLRNPAEWNGAGQGLLHPLRLALEQRGIGWAGANAVDVDAVTGELAGERFGKRDQPAFGGGIDR